jgi:hypothetical protein
MAGFDKREEVGYHVFVSSVLRYASQPVSITPLDSKGLPHGSNSFTLSRFLVPYLCGYKGHAIFADACDMLMLADIAELDALFDDRYAVQVVQRLDYISQHRRKYLGTSMECEQSNYSRKNWASMMLINCEHEAWEWIDPASIADSRPLDLLQLRFCGDSIGNLPACWNVLADESDPMEGAKLLHYTAGSPAFPMYRGSPGAAEWYAQRKIMLEAG